MEVCDPGQDNPTFLRNTDRSEELILLLLGSDHLLFNLQGIPEVYIMHFDHPPLALRSICSTANPDPVALLMQFPHWFTNKSMNFPFFISSSPWINQGAIKVIKMIKFYAFCSVQYFHQFFVVHKCNPIISVSSTYEPCIQSITPIISLSSTYPVHIIIQYKSLSPPTLFTFALPRMLSTSRVKTLFYSSEFHYNCHILCPSVLSAAAGVVHSYFHSM